MKDTFIVAIKSILLNKVRSFLTMLGVIIGVGSVVLLTSIGNGLSAYVTSEFDELGANTFYVLPGDIIGENGAINAETSATSLAGSKITLNHVREISRLRDHVKMVSPMSIQADSISYREEEISVSVLGAQPNIEDAFNVPAEKGSFFGDTEYDDSDRVVVLGYQIAQDLFGSIDPIGKKVSLGNQSFRVIGVVEEKGSGFGGPSFDTFVYMPMTTFSKFYDNDAIVRVIIKTIDTENMEAHKAAIEKLLLKSLEDDEFSVVDQAELLDSINQILGVLTAGLGGIASISLVVGGIGIMNIMLVSVTERTREIGLRKALGATPNMILLQFLIEAAVLSLLGGIIGVLIAFLGTFALQSFVPAAVTLEAVALAFGVSTIVGLVFGAAPARRAAQLSPIEALRYE
ncbi:MAG: putative transport system permease protein [Patescibacteria group bacterium]|nr:putative transport system permease protein [Patescibacteria group bacterium]